MYMEVVHILLDYFMAGCPGTLGKMPFLPLNLIAPARRLNLVHQKYTQVDDKPTISVFSEIPNEFF